MIRSVLFTIMLLAGSACTSKAQFGQFGCVDSLSFPLPNPPCYNDFIPVCGCDDVTYMNFCHWQYAALNFYSEGPCEQVAVSFYPNPVTEFINLRMATRFEADVNLYIFDRNGTIMYYRFLRNVTNEQLYIPVHGFRQGMYFIIAESNGEARPSKFMKWD